MSLIVQKYGNSLLADTCGIINAAGRIADTFRDGNSVVVVVSSQGNTTGELFGKAMEVNSNLSKRELDMLVSAGEQISAALLAAAVEKHGFHAISFTGYQAGIATDSNYSGARIISIDAERIYRELDKRNIVIVAGSQGYNKFEDITTMGPGGTDTSAVALAAALRADFCEIYTDTGGIYTADPQIVEKVGRLREISYDEMLELKSLGVEIIHKRAVEMAKKYNILLYIKSSSDDEPGTIIKEADNVEKMLIKGVTRDNDIARIAAMGVEDKPGVAFRLFSILAKENISVDLILQSIGRDETEDISFTVSKSNLEKALKVINENIGILGAKEIRHSDQYSKVSIIGAGIVNNPEVVATIFEALYDSNINIHMITTSETKISVLVDAQNADMAVNSVHERFKLYELTK